MEVLAACAQVYEFTSPQGDALFIADPPAGIQLPTLLSWALSRALHSPLALPLEPLLSCTAADLSVVRQALLPASPTTCGGVPASSLLASHMFVSTWVSVILTFSFWSSQQQT